MPTRMTKAERAYIDRLDSILIQIASLQPANPMDVKAKLANLTLATSAARMAHRAIGAWRQDAHEWADAELSEAERVLTPGG